jgi:hypothetical protein
MKMICCIERDREIKTQDIAVFFLRLKIKVFSGTYQYSPAAQASSVTEELIRLILFYLACQFLAHSIYTCHTPTVFERSTLQLLKHRISNPVFG